METLHERLLELAEVSDERPDPGTAAMAADRGRAYRRRRRVGTGSALVAAAAALVVVFGVTMSRSAGDLEPAPANAPTGIPSEIFEPSPWLPGTGDDPLGVLAGIVPAERGTWSGPEQGLVGISATTGDYRFLDLPDQDSSELSRAALSPDGRRLAYWTTGETRGSPNTLGGDPVTGVAIYDSATGDTTRLDIETEHGLAPEGLMWLERTRVFLGYGQYVGGDADSDMDQGTWTGPDWFTWRLGDDTAEATELPSNGWVGSAADGWIVQQVDESHHVATQGSRASDTYFEIGNDWSTSPLVDASGHMVAYVAGSTKAEPNNSRNPNRVLVGRLPRAGGASALEARPIPGSGRTFEVLAWTDARHVALLQREGDSYERERVVVADVRTGDLRMVTVGDLGGTFRPGQVATDLLDEPPIAAPEPPRPLDPRAVTVLTGVVVASAAVGLILWRRRVRA